jgi:Uma2 family endonuclease
MLMRDASIHHPKSEGEQNIMATALRWTSADLANFPDDGKRREIIDGELYVSKQPNWYHQVICIRIGGLLDAWSMPTQAGQAAVAPGLIFADDDDVAPDVVWASRERLAAILAGGKLHAAPELVIEVLSPGKKNIDRDRETKLKLYTRRGVAEYWIVDWPRHSIDLYRRDGELLTLAARLRPGDMLSSPLLPGFSAPLDQVFAGVPAGPVEGEEADT